VLGRPALRARAAARLVGVALAAAGLCAVTAIPASADAVRDQEMWVLDMIQAPSAWAVTQGQGVTVAVIDSGVNPSVSDLAGSVISGPDLSGVDTPPSSASWGVHGTWMASLIAGHGHGGGSSGIIGVAPQSRVLSIRVVTDKGDPNFGRYQGESNTEVQQALARAITIATQRGAGVISMSLGYGASSRVVRAALQNAMNHGVVVVASSGNSGDSARALSTGQAPYSFPADYPGVLGVGAVTQSGTAASFSSDNLSVEVAAPGVKVPAQGRDAQYWLVSGTSPACALTAGVAALIKSRYPHLSPALVEQAITSSAQNPPPQGYNDRVGFGTVDAAAALTAAARLGRDVDGGRGVNVAAHFGGGPGSTSPVPVPPRDRGRLALYALLALVCLAVAVVAAVRLTRRPLAGAGDGGPDPDDGRRPDHRSWPDHAQPPGIGERPGNGQWPGSGQWPASEPWPGNGSQPASEPKAGDKSWPGAGPQPASEPWPGNGSQPATEPRGGNGSWVGSGSWPASEPRPDSQPWLGGQPWPGSGTWPDDEPWPAEHGRPDPPSGIGPAPPDVPPAPPYRRPDLPPPETPPAPAPPADPGPPRLSLGP